MAPDGKFSLDKVEQMSMNTYFSLMARKQCCQIVRTANRKWEEKPFYCVILSSLLTIFFLFSTSKTMRLVIPALPALVRVLSDPGEAIQ